MKPKIGVLIYTYDRTDDARINMEIIRMTWRKSSLLNAVTLVHAFNGEKNWWNEKYLEDRLVYCENPGHFKGAEILINNGMKEFKDNYPDTDYVIVVASDTWCVKPEYIEDVILNMQKSRKYLATCSWGDMNYPSMFKSGMSVDFFIVDFKWASRCNFFPLGYAEFIEKYSELFLFQNMEICLENVFVLRFKQAIRNSVKIPSENLRGRITYEHIHHLVEREPVHYFEKTFFRRSRGERKRRMYWEAMGLITHHEPEPKQKVLREWNLNLGKEGQRFLSTKDLSYFNRAINRPG